jgi:hypothetical protein
MISSKPISFASCALNHNVLCFEFPWSRHIRSQIFRVNLVCARFSTLSSVLCSSSSFFVTGLLPLPSFIHFTDPFVGNPWLPCFPVDFPQSNHPYYPTHTSLCCCTALPHFCFPCRFHLIFLLEYLAFSVVKKIISPNLILNPLLETFVFLQSISDIYSQ